MKILIACEESQRVCTAMREAGHEAYSCDIVFCSGNHPEWHIWKDVSSLLNGNCYFLTCDGQAHYINKWDMIIAFPQFKNSHGKYKQRNRSKTFEEVAKAMALSWGVDLETLVQGQST